MGFLRALDVGVPLAGQPVTELSFLIVPRKPAFLLVSVLNGLAAGFVRQWSCCGSRIPRCAPAAGRYCSAIMMPPQLGVIRAGLNKGG
ncbi:hypothetical protein [uncultured Paracoccus sp.]|uniref:hypothetical protein n=1 Tax=uncultured Paracoccus sp. TaxID=189685 RepID=UPI00260A51CC|nr:hypothetical protein [uncultured Paracoccus sp.]